MRTCDSWAWSSPRSSGPPGAVQRLAAVPGLGVDSAQQIIAEVGSTAMTFPTAKHLAFWVGTCPGHDESAGINCRRFVVRLGHAQAIGAIAHRLCRLVWKILHGGVTYKERGSAVHKARAHRRVAKMLRKLRSLGYHVELSPAPSESGP